MSLTSALGSALSACGSRRWHGVAWREGALARRATSHAGTPATRKSGSTRRPRSSARASAGSARGAVIREYDAFVLRQLQGERSNGAYASTRAEFLARVDQVFGPARLADRARFALQRVFRRDQGPLGEPRELHHPGERRSPARRSSWRACAPLRPDKAMRLDAERASARRSAAVNGILDSSRR